MRYSIRYFAFGTTLAWMTWAPAARADDTAQSCAAAHEAAQMSKREGKYVAALEQAKSCTRSECSSILVNECVRMYDQIQSEIPTFVFAAKSGDGAELTSVRVLVDGEPVLDKLDGSPRAFDPGVHVFRFEAPGLPPAEITHTARVGDRNRLIEAVLGDQPAAPSDAPGPGDASAVTAEPKGIPAASYVLGSVGLLALGGFAYLRLSGIADYNELNEECSPRCDDNEVDDIRLKFTASYVALGLSAVAIGSAVTIYLLRGDNNERTPTTEVGLAPTPGGGSARFITRF
jgi:hypothetical protein